MLAPFDVPAHAHSCILLLGLHLPSLSNMRLHPHLSGTYGVHMSFAVLFPPNALCIPNAFASCSAPAPTCRAPIACCKPDPPPPPPPMLGTSFIRTSVLQVVVSLVLAFESVTLNVVFPERLNVSLSPFSGIVPTPLSTVAVFAPDDTRRSTVGCPGQTTGGIAVREHVIAACALNGIAAKSAAILPAMATELFQARALVTPV